MGISRKIFMIYLHNLQMLFMLRIKYKFSECLAPCTNMKAPMEDFLAAVLPRPADTGAFAGSYPRIFFVLPQILLCSEKFVLNT